MVEIIVSVAAKVAEYLVDPVVHPFRYLWYYKSNTENLKKEVGKLKYARDRVQHDVDDAVRKGERIEKDVDEWLTAVNKIIEQHEEKANDLVDDEEKAKRLCSNGVYANLKIRYQLSKNTVRQVNDIAERLQEKEKFDRVSYRAKPEEIPNSPIKCYEELESRRSTLNSILGMLRDPNVNMIGVCGMGGVGKTTLAKEVERRAKVENLFDKVVFAVVSPNPDREKIQKKIADDLDFQFKEYTESGRARYLRHRLKDEQKILVILDDIWKHLDLENVGIPFGEDHKGCKILLISRDQHVLSNDMGCKTMIPVDALQETEAWNLFKKIAGDDLPPVANDVAKECAGLPIAIVTVAKALSGKSVSEWRAALRGLRRPSPRNFTGVPAEAYKSIELSYHQLEDEELKACFLLIGYSIVSCIQDLRKYGMGLGLFEGSGTMEGAFDEVYASVCKLKSSGLLLDGDTSESFSMHDVVRNVAISIASRDGDVFSAIGDVVLREWEDTDKLKKCRAISLDDTNVNEFPKGLECPQLKLCCICSKDRSFKITDNTFTGMTELRVLDLTRIHVLSLPSSVNLLLNLRTLCLDQCKLGDISTVGDLKKLEILSLLMSDIERLPEEIGQLTQLRLLDLSGCSKLKVIPPNVISRLSRLEELYMGGTYVEWEVEGVNVERRNASLEEFKHLSQLTSLEIHIQDEKVIPKGLLSKKLERYKILIGDEWEWSENLETSRTLKLKLSSSIFFEDGATTQLQGTEDEIILKNDTLVPFFKEQIAYSNLETLELCEINCKYLFSYSMVRSLLQLQHLKISRCTVLEELVVLEDLHSRNDIEFPSLKALKIDQCPQLKAFILKNTSTDMTAGIQPFFNEKVAFSSLEKIVIQNVDNLKIIWQNQVSDHSNFCKLKSLNIQGCDKLATIFPSNMFGSFSQLEILSVAECGSLEEIFEGLVLNFEEIIEWNKDPEGHSSFQNLHKVKVKKCQTLKYLFPLSIAKSLLGLQELEMDDCCGVQEIVAEEGRANAHIRLAFPRLNFLRLQRLPNLRVLYPGTHSSEWPMLKRLVVTACDKVTMFAETNEGQLDMPAQQPLFMDEKAIPNMEHLTLCGKDMTMIPEYIFHKLKSFDVTNDESTSFPVGFLERFHNLKRLAIHSTSYKEIFPYGAKTSLEQNIWKQDSRLDSFLQDLELLHVHHCCSLINLLPSSVSFKCLTTLEVLECDGLKNLLTSSTSKTLVQLEMISVHGSKTMTEIVANETDVTRDEVTFSKLKTLVLHRMPSLTSFCSANYTFRFPSLDQIDVKGCPKMKVFSHGIVSTPRLQHIHVEKKCQKGDLNTTIQQLLKEVYVQNSEEDSGQPSTSQHMESNHFPSMLLEGH